MQRSRPLGVTIIAILAVIGGIGSVLSGFAIMAIIPLLGIIFGGLLIIVGLAYFVVAYGLWKGLNWAWNITLIVSVIGIIVGLGFYCGWKYRSTIPFNCQCYCHILSV